MAASDRPSYDPTVTVMKNVLKLCVEKGADAEIKEGVELAIKLAETRSEYCEKVTTEPSQALKDLANDTLTYPFQKAFEEGKTQWNLKPAMMSGHLEGKLLQSIVMMNNAKKVLEIGMFTGYAALACAEVLPTDGEVVTCEFDPFLEEVAKDFFKKSAHGKKIDIKIGPANNTMRALAKENKKFDVIFIDANKDGYKEYYEIVMSENLLSENGVIVFDNALNHGMPYCLDDPLIAAKTTDKLQEGQKKNGRAIADLNKFMITQDNVFKVLLPVRDGMLIVQRKPQGL